MGDGIAKLKKLGECEIAVLNAFQLSHWKLRVENPIPVGHGRNRYQSLRNACKRLNRRQKLIHIALDGTKLGICWEPNPK